MIALGVVRPVRRRRRWAPRAFGWIALAAVVPALSACTARGLNEPTPDAGLPGSDSAPVVTNRNVDLLFLIDDSTSMRLSQANLLRNFPLLMTALKNLPGGLPNIHIAVVSSDMGAHDDIGQCAGQGKAGIFQTMQRGSTCAATSLMGNYIADVAGVRNYTGNLEDVFSCIAALGDDGCGYEQPFAALTRALGADGQPPPAENQGFLRPDAYLAIVMISNEDDCSAAPGVPLFDAASSTNLASELGPPTNFRCNEFGHICDGAPPVRLAPGGDVDATHTYGTCLPAEGSGRLLTVADTAARIRALKADPDSQIFFAAITGPAAPYAVHWKAPLATDDRGPWPEITHSCTAVDGSFADPAIRTTALAGAFGANGLMMSICDDSFAPALLRVAEEISDHVAQP